MTVTPTPVVKPKSRLSRLLAKAAAFIKTPKGHRIEIVVITYVITELERRGYLPAIPIPKP